MLTILSGMGLLLLTLAAFSLFSMKMPKGSEAMSGMANAAVASVLVEAVHSYITGDLFGFEFFKEVGVTAGSLGGVAAAVMVPISMGANPVFAVVAGLACGGYGILPGFIAGYIIGLVSPIIEKKLPEGLNIIAGALVIAPLARFIAFAVNPVVDSTLLTIGETISAAASQSPIVMGFLLGGIMKMMPGMGQYADMLDESKANGSMKKTKAIIQSMTKYEREHPEKLRGTMKKRIARGSGTKVDDVNRLINQFNRMKKTVGALGAMNRAGTLNEESLNRMAENATKQVELLKKGRRFR